MKLEAKLIEFLRNSSLYKESEHNIKYKTHYDLQILRVTYFCIKNM